MCGICGVIEPEGKSVDPQLLLRMRSALLHRGPDDQGSWSEGAAGLAQTRLAIIDLNPRSNQPFFSEDQNLVLVYNGEIYNFPELRRDQQARGCRFRTDSDTETLIHGYRLDGEDFIAGLNSMFAFALWDRQKRRLLLARDRPGMKPLYYHLANGRLVFASEIHALLQDPAIPRELDPAALYHYLNLSYVPSPYTMFKGIRKFPAGCYGFFENGELRITPYFRHRFQIDERTRGEDEWAEELLASFRRAVKRHMLSDVPLGAFLSGGIDSSAVVAAMVHAAGKDRVRAFSITNRDAEYDESAYARAMAKHVGCELTEFRIETGGFEMALLDRVVRHYGEPFADYSALPVWEVARLAREHVTVALTGDGGDELFAGYDNYRWLQRIHRARRLPDTARRALLTPLLGLARQTPGLRNSSAVRQAYRGLRLSLLPEDQVYSGIYSQFFPPETDFPLAADFERAITAEERVGAFEAAIRQLPEDATPLQKALHFTFQFGLEGQMLKKVDRMTMAVALEARQPFLDAELIDLALRMPDELKLNRGRQKYILKRAMQAQFPPEVIGHRKWGFTIPLRSYFNDAILKTARELLDPARVRAQGIFDPARVERCLKQFVAFNQNPAGQLSAHQICGRLWALIVFQRWHQEYLE